MESGCGACLSWQFQIYIDIDIDTLFTEGYILCQVISFTTKNLLHFDAMTHPIQNTGKSRQMRSGTGIAKFTGAAPL